MKIVATLTNVGGVVHVGAGIDTKSVIIEIPEPLPPLLKRYLESVEWGIEHDKPIYDYLSFSLLEESEATKKNELRSIHDWEAE